MTVIPFPGLDSSESLTRFPSMRTELPTLSKRAASAPSKTFKVGDRATFAGAVLRVLPGDAKTLLVMVEANGLKLTIKPEDVKGGSKLRGGDPVRSQARSPAWAPAQTNSLSRCPSP